jgi:hypothetical protein
MDIRKFQVWLMNQISSIVFLVIYIILIQQIIQVFYCSTLCSNQRMLLLWSLIHTLLPHHRKEPIHILI